MNALLLQRIQVRRQRGHERFAFAGHHLGNIAVMQHDAAQDLHIEVPHVLGAVGGLAAGGKGLGQQRFEWLAIGQALAELWRQSFELFRAEGMHFFF